MQPRKGIDAGIPRNATLRIQINKIQPRESIGVGIARITTPRMLIPKMQLQKAKVLGFTETQPQKANTQNSIPWSHWRWDYLKRSPQNANTPNSTPEGIRVRISWNATPRMQIPKGNPQNTQNATPRSHRCWDSPIRNPQNAKTQDSIPRRQRCQDSLQRNPQNAKYPKCNQQKASLLVFPETKPPELKIPKKPRKHWCIDSPKCNPQNANTQNTTPTIHRCRDSPKRNPKLSVLLYVFKHKTKYILIHAPHTRIMAFWHQ